jgi:hypothetical protein
VFYQDDTFRVEELVIDSNSQIVLNQFLMRGLDARVECINTDDLNTMSKIIDGGQDFGQRIARLLSEMLQKQMQRKPTPVGPKTTQHPVLNYTDTFFWKFILSWVGQPVPFESDWRRQAIFYAYKICTTYQTPEDTSENWTNANLDCWTPLDSRDDIRINYMDLLCLYIKIIEPQLKEQFLITHSADVYYSNAAMRLLEEPLYLQLKESPKNAFMFENALILLVFTLDTRMRRFCLSTSNAMDALKCRPPDTQSTQALIKVAEDINTKLCNASTYQNFLATGSFLCQFIIYGQSEIPYNKTALACVPLVCFPQAHWTL